MKIQPILEKYPRVLENFEIRLASGTPLYGVRIERLYDIKSDAWSLLHIDDWKYLGDGEWQIEDEYDYLWGIFDRATSCLDGSSFEMPTKVRLFTLNNIPSVVSLKLVNREFLNFDSTEIVDEEFNIID